MLLESSADIATIHRRRKTCVYIAAQAGQEDVKETLLVDGAKHWNNFIYETLGNMSVDTLCRCAREAKPLFAEQHTSEGRYVHGRRNQTYERSEMRQDTNLRLAALNHEGAYKQNLKSSESISSRLNHSW